MRKEMIRKRTAEAILAVAAAVIFCPIAALSTWGAMAIHNKIAEVEIEKRTVEEVYIPYDFAEYIDQEELLPEAGVQVNPLRRGLNTIDFTLAAGRSKTLAGEQVTAGNGIRVTVYGKNSADQFKVGIIEPSGNKRAVFSHNGGVSYTFDVEETGTYQVYFENMESSSIQFSGVVYMDY